jgi:hypothetical protein
VTEQASVTEPTTVPFVQVTEPTPDATPVPLMAITMALFVEELLSMVSFPVLSPAAGGTKFAVRVAVWPGLRVNGTAGPVTVKLPE